MGYLGGSGAFAPVYDFYLPLLYPYGNFAIAVYVVITAYAIVRHRFLDIEVIIKRTLVFTGLLSFVFFVVVGVSYLVQDILSGYVGLHRLVSLLVSALAIVASYDPLRRLLERVTEKSLFQSQIDYERIEEEVSNSIKITDLDRLCHTLVDLFYREMKLENALLFLHDEKKKAFRIGAARGIGQGEEILLREEDRLLQGLRKDPQRTVFLKADLAQEEEDLAEGFTRLHSEALAQVVFEDRLIALLSLGKKKSDEAYGTRDSQLLLKAANQMAVSISHATTFRLQRDYYVLQAQRNKSDALSRLSEGLDHEIKNPLNQIRPRLENVLTFYQEKAIQPECAFLIDSLETSMRHVDRISRIMERLRRFARPVETEALQPAPVPLKPFLEEAVGLISAKQLEEETRKTKREIRLGGSLSSLKEEPADGILLTH